HCLVISDSFAATQPQRSDHSPEEQAHRNGHGYRRDFVFEQLLAPLNLWILAFQLETLEEPAGYFARVGLETANCDPIADCPVDAECCCCRNERMNLSQSPE